MLGLFQEKKSFSAFPLEASWLLLHALLLYAAILLKLLKKQKIRGPSIT